MNTYIHTHIDTHTHRNVRTHIFGPMFHLSNIKKLERLHFMYILSVKLSRGD